MYRKNQGNYYQRYDHADGNDKVNEQQDDRHSFHHHHQYYKSGNENYDRGRNRERSNGPDSGRSWSRGRGLSRSRSPERTHYNSSYHNNSTNSTRNYGNTNSRPDKSNMSGGRRGGENTYVHNEGYSSLEGGHRERKRSRFGDEHNKRDFGPGEATNTVVLRGLPPWATEEDINSTLAQMQASLDSVRLIRDRATGASRCFAFAQFTSVEHARQFISSHFPNFPMGEAIVRVEYSKNAMDADDWPCSNCGVVNFKRRDACFKCGLAKNEAIAAMRASQPEMMINDGSHDISDIPFSLLVVRGLDPLTSCETLFSAFSLVPAANVLDVRIIRDRMSNISWGFGMVSFADVANAAYVLQTVYDPRLYPSGFMVDSRAVSVNYCQTSSFIPVYGSSQWTIPCGPDGTSQMTYWDEQAFAQLYKPTTEVVEPQVPTISSASPPSIIGPTIPASCTSQSSPLSGQSLIPIPEVETTVIKSEISLRDELTAFYNDVASAPSSENSLPISQVTESKLEETKPTSFSWKKKINASKSLSQKKIQKQLEQWETIKQEAIEVDSKEPEVSSQPTQENVAIIDKEPEMSQLDIEEMINGHPNYTNTEINACLLCQRQFKSIEQLQKHQKLSNLHKSNLESLPKDLITELFQQFKEKSIKYRNRAKERRTMYGQPNKPALPHSKYSKISDSVQKSTIVLSASSSAADGIGDDNIGKKMLRNMGWKAGEGLGKHGTGIKAPIQAEMHAPGAGLGSSSSASSNPLVHNQDMKYQERVKLMARMRYEGM